MLDIRDAVAIDFPSANTSSPAVVSISELNRQARKLLESGFPLIWVAGEVSNLTRASSGHVYFSLKDDAAQVRCVMFRQRAQLLTWSLVAGQQVEAQVRVSLYEPRGDFQLGVESMRRAGIGRLYEAFARLQQQLAAEGLFASERKRAIPRFPKFVGIITSPQAAALQDVLAALQRRAPHLQVQLYPTLVQGEGAVPGIVAALTQASQDARADVLLLVRGGGSIEDLWAFNEADTARAIAASPIPVVSGVGHETDTTIADFVADQRAATPTAAAELVTAHWVTARTQLAQSHAALRRAIHRHLDTVRQRIDTLALRLIHPAVRIERLQDRIAFLRHRMSAYMHGQLHAGETRLWELQGRLQGQRPDARRLHQHLSNLRGRVQRAAHGHLQRDRARLEHLAARLQQLDPARTVARGYAIVRDSQHRLLADASALQAGDRVHIQLANGGADAEIRAVSLAVAPYPKPD